MTSETDVKLPDGRSLHVYDTGTATHTATATRTATATANAGSNLVVLYHHGTPNIGEPPAPLLPLSAELGIRWVSYDRPGYGGSTPHLGRSVGSAAADAAAVADALGLDRFAVMGHSGGSPHALACAALLPDRVRAVLAVSTLAPYPADGLEWFAGMAAAGSAELRAALRGRAVLEALLSSTPFDPEIFTPADHAALSGDWSWFNRVAGKGMDNGLDPMVDDDRAYIKPWGFDPAAIGAPTLLLHGAEDRIAPVAHAQWVNDRCAAAELWIRPDDGHISIMRSAPDALRWLLERAA
ncbi:MAG TPA: alpha/beta fold hydrolase [Actinocrinis sp.]|nr:alpha/beta fold hydrolase [Actinocrinis sp.]